MAGNFIILKEADELLAKVSIEPGTSGAGFMHPEQFTYLMHILSFKMPTMWPAW